MEKIAYYAGGTGVGWSGIVLALAAGTAMCFFLAFYLEQEGEAAAAFAALPLSLGLGILFARLFHWYCRPDGYSGFLAAMTDYRSGGYALMGAFLGCLLAAWLLRAVGACRSLGKLLDCMSLGGLEGIALGRLASFFDSSDRGQIISLRVLPFSYPVTNAVSGAREYRFATFLFQSLAALALFLILARFYRRERRGRRLRDGDTCLIFLLCYCASQVVLDSTRYDSLFSRSNGFVSVVQVLSAVTMGVVIVIFSRRLVKTRGFRAWYIAVWAAMAAALGLAGYMEYYVQRHGSAALMAYSLMTLALGAVAGLALLLRGAAQPPRRRNLRERA